MPIARQETGLNLSRLAEGEVDPIGRLPPEGLTAYKGTCHCGRNRFEVHLREAQITNALACNCSLCHKAGYLWAIPEAGDINYLKAGSKEKSLVADTVGLESYETEALRHQFCTSCGTGLYGTHKAGPLENQPGINIRCILGINPFNIKANDVDTAAAVHEKPIELPRALIMAHVLEVPEEQQQEGATFKAYTGSCQCGSISFSVKTLPLLQVEIKEDNCSICVRRAAITIYPDKDQVLFLPDIPQSSEDEENGPTTVYSFARKFNKFPFCKVCGVACFGIPVGPPQEVVSRLPADKQQFVEKLRRIRPLYIRAMNEVEWDEITVVRSDEGTEGYVVGSEDGKEDEG